MNTKLQILCAWAGPLFIVLLTPIWYNMGFLPPLAPTLTPDQVASFYDEHRSAIRLGATLLMQLTMLGVLWVAAISAQIRRIEAGNTPVLSYANLALGSLGFLLFVFPAIFWTVAAYRAGRDAQLIYMLNDQAWLALVMPVTSASLQALVIGIAILSDQRAEPIYPRWVAFVNFWTAVTFLPGALATFFVSGPFAWNGIFDFWIPLTTFSIWIFVMGALTAKAARRQAAEAIEAR